MFPFISGSTQQYLAELDRQQKQMLQTQSQITSGVRVQKPSDDPTAVAEILQTQAEISTNQQIQSNLGNVSTEVNTADSALQTAVQALESAISVAAQGASSSTSADARASLAQQVSGLQATIVGIAQTTVQ